MAPEEFVGWLGASLVFAAFCAREMRSLRLLAIASNVAFISYGCADHLWPIVFLHAAMLPVNAVRLRQLLRGDRASSPRSRLLRWPSYFTAPPVMPVMKRSRNRL